VRELKRSLGLFDVALFFVIACTNLQWVATAAAAGPRSLPVWLIGCLAMFVPIAVVVMALSRRYPEEGGMYVWSKRAFGPFAGYMSGWTYWCTNLPYFPALLYFMAGNALFIGGSSTKALSGSPAYFLIVALTGFALATVVNMMGMDVGKWLNNIGAITRLAVTFVLIGLGIYTFTKAGAATPITLASMRPSLQLKDVIFWSVIAFAWTGAEAIPFMAGEVKDPRKTIPRGLTIGTPGIAAIYIAGTASVLVLVSSGHASALYAVMQAISQASSNLRFPALGVACAVLVTISCLGSTGAWLGIAARIPFVAGIDRYLPESFAYVHPKTGAPVVALLTQAGISVVFILLGQGGTTVKGAYDVLVSATVLITMIPFLLLFSSAMKLRGGPLVYVASIIGILTTTVSMILAAFPADDDPNKPLAVAKVLVLTVLTIGTGAIFYAWGKRRQQAAGVPVSTD
jgi:amino acid transporter